MSRIDEYLINCCERCGCEGLPEPISTTDKLLHHLAETLENGGSGGASSPLKYKRLNLDFAASDLTPRYAQTDANENELWGFSSSEDKSAEVAELMEELSALNTVYMGVSLSVPGIGEFMRTAANFKVKNSATNSNGQICIASYNGMLLIDGALKPQYDIVSIYTKGIDIYPSVYAEAVAMMGATIAIDVIYL